MVTVSALPLAIWPILLLAAIQLVDGLICLRPVPFIAQCLTDVAWPREYWWVMPLTKFVALAGLIAGMWVPYLGALTSAALVAYFIAAITMHVRAQDFGRNLFVNALGMLAICLAVTVGCFLRVVPTA